MSCFHLDANKYQYLMSVNNVTEIVKEMFATHLNFFDPLFRLYLKITLIFPL